jgi:hypothetical protein
MHIPKRDVRSTPGRFLVSGLFAAVLSLILASAASAETLRFKLRGQEAVAGFASTDPTGCVVTHVFIAAMDAEVKLATGGAGPDSRSIADVSQFDRCTSTELLHARGETLLPPEALTITPLESARLHATLFLVDHVSGDPVALSVDLTWSATGETARVKDHYQFKSPVSTINARFSALSREAGAQGTVSNGPTNLTPQPAQFALLNSIKAGSLEITH